MAGGRPDARTLLTPGVLLFLVCFQVPRAAGVMTFPDTGVYSLFPNEDLNTGRRIRFEDDPGPSSAPLLASEAPNAPDRGRDDLSEMVVPILRPGLMSSTRASLPSSSSSSVSQSPFRSTERSDRLRKLNIFTSTSSKYPIHPYDPPNIFQDDEDASVSSGGSSRPLVDPSAERHRYYSFTDLPRPARVFFEDDERRLYGYGGKYHYHSELPPRPDDPSSETNVLRPSPLDHQRDVNLHRFLLRSKPKAGYLPEAKLPPYAYAISGKSRRPSVVVDDDERPPTRVHLFTTHNIDKFGVPFRMHHIRKDGPVVPQVPGPGAFLNHDEYLDYHTKLALATLDSEKKKLEDSRRKFLAKGHGLSPPPTSKTPEVQQSSSGGGGAQEDCVRLRKNCREDGNHQDGGLEKKPTTYPPSYQAGFVPSNPFVIKGLSSPKTPLVPLNRPSTSLRPLSPSRPEYGTSTTFNLPETSTAGSTSSEVQVGNVFTDKKNQRGSTTSSFGGSTTTTSSIGTTFALVQPKPQSTGSSATSSAATTTPKLTTMMDGVEFGTITTENGHDDSTSVRPLGDNETPPMTTLEVEYGHTEPDRPVVEVTSMNMMSPEAEGTAAAAGGPTGVDETTSNTVMNEAGMTTSMDDATMVLEKNMSTPLIFVDSGEIDGYYINSTGGSEGDPSGISVHVQRVRNGGKPRRFELHSESHTEVNETTIVTEITAGTRRNAIGGPGNSLNSNRNVRSKLRVESTMKFPKMNAKIDGVEEVSSSPTTNSTDSKVNATSAGVVSKVHAHISECPKLYGSVEIICDVTIKPRHGDPNPRITVGWIRKFYNETEPDKVVAVNKKLAYEEDFSDKFNVTLAPGISPTLRSVLTVREVMPQDCGNYQCDVFDGISSYKSDTLLFLCH